MKLDQICKYIGLASLAITTLLLLGGLIGFYSGELLNVKRYTNFFWFANTFALFGILNLLAFLVLRHKD